MRPVRKIADELALLQEYRYIVERYLAGLARLTVAAYPIENEGDPIFITFMAVKYMQMPTFWQKAPFILGAPNQCQAFLKSVGIDIVSDLPDLFYAQLPKSRVYVVCWGVEISEVMPL